MLLSHSQYDYPKRSASEGNGQNEEIRQHQRSTWTQAGIHASRDQRPYAPPSPPVEQARMCSLPSIKDLLDFQPPSAPGWPPATRPLESRTQSLQQQRALVQHGYAAGINSAANHPRRSPAIPTVSLSIANGAPSWKSSHISHPAHGAERQQDNRSSFASTDSVSSAHTSTTYSTSATSADTASPSYGPALPAPHESSKPSRTQQRALLLDFPPHHHQYPPHSPPLTTSACTSPESSRSTSVSWRKERRDPRSSADSASTTSNSTIPASSAPDLSTTDTSPFYPTDRYICPTCAKAFSRPSSLRIHSHSHTGEKPFRCPQRGCGKAFSVRSNMKRHERGCHADRKAAMSAGGVDGRGLGGDPYGSGACVGGVREILPAVSA